MKRYSFTLVELLIVVGILGILAGLIIPAVIGAKQQGRITQARADMSSIRTAFEQLNTRCGKMMRRNGSNYELGGVSWGSAADGCVTIGTLNNNEYNSLQNYCRVIAELADPQNSGVTPSLNRAGAILEPKTGYDKTASCISNANQGNTWLDPWGNPYMIRVNVDASENIPDPSASTTRMLSGRIILWSLGPDGRGGTNYDKDNIPSWKDGNWFD